jgi:pimeloyl-ACP methyl ester carboxylesterase
MDEQPAVREGGRFEHFTTCDGHNLRIYYREALCGTGKDKLLVLIHGFPQTSYQFRHVMAPFARLGYHVIAPDYRGAGRSTRPASGYTKAIMADDMKRLIASRFSAYRQIHVIGHDVGGMIAHTLASERSPSDIKLTSVIWGEACLPGSAFYERTKYSIDKFHFQFHRLPNGLAERLISGKEREYLQQFFDRLLYKADAISIHDLMVYVDAYSQPDAIRAAMDLYRAFPKDAEQNIERVRKSSKCTVRCLQLNGAESDHACEAQELMDAFYDQRTSAIQNVADAGHYIAEENPSGFVEAVHGFIEQQR